MIAAGLSDLLATIAPTSPSHLRQGETLPALTYLRVSTTRDQSHDGPTGLVSARYQVNVHAATYSQAASLAAEVVALLNGFGGELGGSDVGNVEVSDEVDLGWIDDTQSYQVAVDAIIHYKE